MSSESISLPQLHIKIDELYNKYSDNSNILSKLNQYILIDMPNLLDNIQKNLISKENRRLSLQNAFDKFHKRVCVGNFCMSLGKNTVPHAPSPDSLGSPCFPRSPASHHFSSSPFSPGSIRFAL